MQGLWVHAPQRWHTVEKTGHRIEGEGETLTEWDKLIPRPRSSFVRVKCLKCGNEQMVFSHAVNKVVCNVCGFELAEPSGGKAKIKGEIVAVFE